MLRGAYAFFFWIAEIAAGAWVHSAYQKNVGRIGDASFRARDRNHAVFQGLAQCFQHTLVKFGKLVHKQNTAVRKGYFPRPREGASAHKRNVGRGVMRTSEWAFGNDAVLPCGGTYDAVDFCDFNYLFPIWWRENRRKRAG